ncbi:hypothetical protein ACWGK5_25600 [Rhodococcus qingshengii]
MSKPMTLEQYKAQVDAKYANVRKIQEQHERDEQERKRKDHWLLVNAAGAVDGVTVRWGCSSAIEAFEFFFPDKKERHRKAAEGWRIETDDADGSRWAAACAHSAARP